MTRIGHDWVPLLLEWYRREKRDFPWRTVRNPYHTWVCEVMSQQTTLAVVLPKFKAFVEELPTVESLAVCEEPVLRRLWAGLGYYARARNLQKGARHIMETRNGRFPETYMDWLAVPGCGPYSAAVISSIAFGCPAACVDGNVVRVVSRLLALESGVWDSQGQARIQGFVDAALPADAPGDFNQAMMELGATICRKQNPDCLRCPVQDACGALRARSVALCPPNKPRKAFVDETLYSFVLHDPASRDVALFTRKAGFLSRTVGFPLLRSSDRGATDAIAALREHGGVTLDEGAAGFSHTITHHRIAGRVVILHLGGPAQPRDTSAARFADVLGVDAADWIAAERMGAALSSSLDKKIWRNFAEFMGRQKP